METNFIVSKKYVVSRILHEIKIQEVKNVAL